MAHSNTVYIFISGPRTLNESKEGLKAFFFKQKARSFAWYLTLPECSTICPGTSASMTFFPSRSRTCLLAHSHRALPNVPKIDNKISQKGGPFSTGDWLIFLVTEEND